MQETYVNLNFPTTTPILLLMHRCVRLISPFDSASKTVLSFARRQEQAQLFYSRCRSFHQQPRQGQATSASVAATSETPVPPSTTETHEAPTSAVEERRSVQTESSHEHQGSQGEEQHVKRTEKGPQTTRTAPSTKTRAQSRLERKLRRERDGTYRRASKDAIAAREIDAYDVEALVSQIEKLDGPKEWEVNPILADEAGASKRQGAVQQGLALKDNKKDTKAPQPRDKSTGEEAVPGPRKPPKPKPEIWKVHKRALEHKFGDKGWSPRKRLSPDTLEGIRALHASDPSLYSTAVLAENFKISPEAIRRILRSKWKPSEEEASSRTARWERRGERKWQEMAAQGARPPAKWRAKGVGVKRQPGEDDKQSKPERSPRRRIQHPIHWKEAVGAAVFNS